MGRASWEVMRPCAQSGSQRSCSGEKIGECHIIAGGEPLQRRSRLRFALQLIDLAGLPLPLEDELQGFDLYIPYNEPAARMEQLPFWSNSLRY
jgi:hypothetical protein